MSLTKLSHRALTPIREESPAARFPQITEQYNRIVSAIPTFDSINPPIICGYTLTLERQDGKRVYVDIFAPDMAEDSADGLAVTISDTPTDLE